MIRLLSLLALLVATRVGAQQRADLLLFNGKVVTVDDRFSIQHAVVIRDGRIVAVGGDSLLSKYRVARTIDLHGRVVLPGFDDTHIHVSGTPRRSVDLAGVRSMAELEERITAKAAMLGPGEWVTGSNWSEDELLDRRKPTRIDLDAAAPANPIVITRAGGHSAAANSMAMRLAGITRDTPDPRGGMIERDPN